jgi:uncharacterized membrane protein HdeD (DUF308 family)
MAAIAEGVPRRAWQIAATRGGLAIVVGALLLVRPGLPLGAVFAMIGSYLFFDGALSLATAFGGTNVSRTRVSYFLEGIVSVCVGILAFVHPATMKLALLALVAARSIIAGLVEIGTAISRRRTSGERAGLGWLAGLASLVFGIFLVVRPASGIVLLAWAAGIYLVVFGISLAATAAGLRRAHAGA